MPVKRRKLPPGIVERPNGKFLAQPYDPRTRERVRGKTFSSVAAAKAYRRDTEAALAKCTVQAGKSPTLKQAATEFMAGAEDGTISSRAHEPYRPPTLRGYRSAFERVLLPRLGSRRLSDIRTGELRALVGELRASGLSESTTRNTLVPLMALFTWALQRELVAVNPCVALQLPVSKGRRENIAGDEEADLMLATLDPRDRPLWACAFYAGLRRGELQALRWEDVDFVEGIIRVERSWNEETGTLGPPKSTAGKRRVPIANTLRDYLTGHRNRSCGGELVFGRRSLAGRRGPDGYFLAGGVLRRAQARWRAQGITRTNLHTARHTFASLMIAAGANMKALSTYMGHASISITMDRYGHLLPGSETEAADRLQEYLDRPRVPA